ncbi:MAG: class I SAM-dependent methyltransferase [Bacteroidota bacterium]
MKGGIRKSVKAIGRIISNPWLLNRVLHEPDQWKEHLQKKYGLLSLPVVGFEELFGEGYKEKVGIFSFLDGGSMVTDLALLKTLAARTDQCRYFEIGTWRGESVANVAQVAKECFTLNLSDEDLRRQGAGEEVISLQAYFSKELPNVTHLYGDSRTFDFAHLGNNFDLIFIDGGHHYDFVRNDTEKVFSHLVNEKTIVVWHDYGLTPEEVRYEVFAGILDGLDPALHGHLCQVGATKSAVYFPWKPEGQPFISPVTPGSYFTVTIENRKW